MIPNFIVIDIENDNTNRYKRNVGNFMYDKIVCIGMKENTMASISTEDYITFYDRLEAEPYIRILVGHNIKHDLLFLWQNKRLQKWLKQGGKIWDTQIAEYYLSSFQNKYPALRDIAVQKYGCKERPKHIDRLLFNNKETINDLCEQIKETGEMLDRYDLCNKNELEEKIIKRGREIDIIKSYNQVSDLPQELVLEDVKNDVLDTEQIFLQQYEACKRRGILEVVDLQMESLLFTIEAEYNGFKIDLSKLQANKEMLKQQLNIAEKNLLNIVKKYWLFQ